MHVLWAHQNAFFYIKSQTMIRREKYCKDCLPKYINLQREYMYMYFTCIFSSKLFFYINNVLRLLK